MYDQLGSWVIFAAVTLLVLYYGVRALMGKQTVRAAEPISDADLGDAIHQAARELAAAADNYCADQAAYIDTEIWLHNRNTSGGAR